MYKQISATLRNCEYHFDTLRYKDKLNRDCEWNCWVKDDVIYRTSRIHTKDSKLREYDTISCKGKNIGKKNETSDHQQALLEAQSMWKKQRDKVHSDVCFPMLAQKLNIKHLRFPIAVSRKIDGIRGISVLQKDDVSITSRLGKSFAYLNNIREHLKLCIRDEIIDGELYSHEIAFSRISGAVRSKKKCSKDDHLIQYWIFDIIHPTHTYKERMESLQKIKDTYHHRVPEKERVLKFVFYDIAKCEQDIYTYHNQYVNEGFEGIMCRNLDSKYIQKYRSMNLQKYKHFEDKEFKIIDFREGKGSEKGAIIYKCTCEDGDFDVRPRGSIEKRKEMFKKGKETIGKWLTVRYQNTGVHDEKELPRFPIGIDIRDYE